MAQHRNRPLHALTWDPGLLQWLRDQEEPASVLVERALVAHFNLEGELADPGRLERIGLKRKEAA